MVAPSPPPRRTLTLSPRTPAAAASTGSDKPRRTKPIRPGGTRKPPPAAPRTAAAVPARPEKPTGAAKRPSRGSAGERTQPARPAAPRQATPPGARPAKDRRAIPPAALPSRPPRPDGQRPALAPRNTPAVTPQPSTGTRLNKYLADAQWCSRREADEWIDRGWVLINGVRANMGQRVQPGDTVDVAAQARRDQAQRLTILLHKPVGYVSGQAEDGHEPAITLLTDAHHWSQDAHPQRHAPRSLKGFAPAGRLDIDSTGLLILTQDGRLARQVIGADSTIDKEYLVRVAYRAADGHDIATNVQAAFPPAQLQLLRHGLMLDGIALKPAEVDWQNPEQLRFVLREGKKRQIRRMCELVGLRVTGLKRVRIGRIALGPLPPGQWRYLSSDETAL